MLEESCSIMIYPSKVFSEDGVTGREAVAQGVSQMLPLDKAWWKAVLTSVSAPSWCWNEANASQEGGGLLRWTLPLLMRQKRIQGPFRNVSFLCTTHTWVVLKQLSLASSCSTLHSSTTGSQKASKRIQLEGVEKGKVLVKSTVAFLGQQRRGDVARLGGGFHPSRL